MTQQNPQQAELDAILEAAASQEVQQVPTSEDSTKTLLNEDSKPENPDLVDGLNQVADHPDLNPAPDEVAASEQKNSSDNSMIGDAQAPSVDSVQVPGDHILSLDKNQKASQGKEPGKVLTKKDHIQVAFDEINRVLLEKEIRYIKYTNAKINAAYLKDWRKEIMFISRLQVQLAKRLKKIG